MKHTLTALLVAALASCASALDGAIVTANAAAEVGDQTERMLADAYRREQEACVAGTDREPEALQCVRAVRAKFAPVWHAYDAFRVAWIAAASAVHAAESAEALGQIPDVAKTLALATKLVAAEQSLSVAVAAVSR